MRIQALLARGPPRLKQIVILRRSMPVYEEMLKSVMSSPVGSMPPSHTPDQDPSIAKRRSTSISVFIAPPCVTGTGTSLALNR